MIRSGEERAMHRRAFLKSTGAAAASATAGVSAISPAAAESVVAPHARSHKLRLAFAWADDIAGPGEQAVRLARRIERATAGRLELVTTTPVRGIEALAASEADLVHGTELRRVDADAAFGFFGGLPGAAGLAPHDLDAWIGVGGGQELWDDLAGAFGAKPLLVGHLGERPALWSTAPIESLADLAGCRVHALGLAHDVLRGAGAEPVALPEERIAEALARGDIAAAECGGALASLALGVPRVAKHVAGFSLSPAGTALSLAVRRGVWDDLGASDQTIIAACAAEELRLSLAETRAHEALVRTTLAARYGVRFAPPDPGSAAAIARLADAVVADLAGRDDRTARISASYMAFRTSIGVDPASGPPTS
jgi:TRAP-type mannitol/chloroaromatic compound transport system substrate-binding protein